MQTNFLANNNVQNSHSTPRSCGEKGIVVMQLSADAYSSLAHQVQIWRSGNFGSSCHHNLFGGLVYTNFAVTE